jgi:hypothetical protein
MANESYSDLRKLLQTCDPRLQRSSLDITAPSHPSYSTWKPWTLAKTKVIALHVAPDNSIGAPIEYTDAVALETHLFQVAERADSTSRYVYLLEGLSRDFVEVFGHHFSLHPSLFTDHERLVPCQGRMTGENGGLPILPSGLMDKDHVAFKYHEPLSLSKCPPGFRCVCETSGRHIAITRLMGKFSSIGTARRKCTFWSKTTTAGGWTSMSLQY